MAYIQKQHKKKVKEWETDYKFDKKEVVVIAHKVGGYFQVKKDSEDEVDGMGDKTEWSQWEAEPSDGGKKVTFQSTKTGKYLQLTENGINAAGDGGKFSIFRVRHANNVIKLESCEFKGQCIGCVTKKQAMVGGGGSYCDIKIYKQ
eukprot:7809_1